MYMTNTCACMTISRPQEPPSQRVMKLTILVVSSMVNITDTVNSLCLIYAKEQRSNISISREVIFQFYTLHFVEKSF